MTVQLYIVTGASRGLGAALASRLLTPGNRLLCLSRGTDASLDERSAAAGVACEQWAVDLTDSAAVAARLEAWLAERGRETPASATLINNAAGLPRIGSLGDCSAAELAATLRVGLEAPLTLSSAFLRATRSWSAPRRVLNISSGLGRHAMAAQAPYSAVKAGIDHFSRCVALEEAGRSNGARIVSLAPGVIDTGMQAKLRDADPDGFPDQAMFLGLKERGQLASTDEAAGNVLRFLHREDFGHNPVADVRDA